MIHELFKKIEAKSSGELRVNYDEENIVKRLEKLKKNCKEKTSGLKDLELIPEGTLRELESLYAEAINIFNDIPDSNEYKGRAAVNASLIWSKSGYVERSIYLAGIAKEKELPEPFKTHINILPSHACLFRYRQINTVHEWAHSVVESSGNRGIQQILNQMKNSYYSQFKYFSSAARSENETHPLSCYHYGLSKLFTALEYGIANKGKEEKKYVDEAESIIRTMDAPNLNSSDAVLTYHKTNCNEFSTFNRLSKRYATFLSILQTHSKNASDIQDSRINKGDEEHKTDYGNVNVNIPKYLFLGGTTASVVSIAALLGYLFDVDPNTIIDVIDKVWNVVHANLMNEDMEPNQLITTALNDGDFLRSMGDMIETTEGDFLNIMRQSMNDGDFV